MVGERLAGDEEEVEGRRGHIEAVQRRVGLRRGRCRRRERQDGQLLEEANEEHVEELPAAAAEAV